MSSRTTDTSEMPAARPDRIRRFSAFAIAFHWLVAIPYLVLFVSGALLMLHRLGWVRWGNLARLQQIHHWSGLALIGILAQLILVGVTNGSIKRVLADVAEWLRPRGRDIKWLLLVPFNIAFPRHVHLPAAGRYNAGQKLHGLFIVAALCTFSISGVMMLIRPGDLRFWIIHSWLFFGAAAFLGLHLFLGLINPPTRKALRGIFSGRVPGDYMREHHGLTMEGGGGTSSITPKPHAVVSAGAIAGAMCVLLLGGAILVGEIGLDRVRANVTHVAGMDHPLISPGPLASVHADEPRAGHCSDCHVAMQSPPDSACLSCHEKVATAMQQHAGFHGTKLTGQCAGCHADHRGRDVDLRPPLTQFAFDHERDARFHLDHLHAKVDCALCHTQTESSGAQPRLHFFPVSMSCEQCHRTIADGMAGKFGTLTLTADPHLGRVKCVDCHATSSPLPTPVQFADACAKCHTDRYRNLYFDWRRSLDERQAAVAHVHDLSPEASGEVEAARQVGIHNASVAIKLLDEAQHAPRTP